jgi:hypothetical protein
VPLGRRPGGTSVQPSGKIQNFPRVKFLTFTMTWLAGAFLPFRRPQRACQTFLHYSIPSMRNISSHLDSLRLWACALIVVHTGRSYITTSPSDRLVPNSLYVLVEPVHRVSEHSAHEISLNVLEADISCCPLGIMFRLVCIVHWPIGSVSIP